MHDDPAPTPELSEDHWSRMTVFRVLLTLGGIAAVIAPLCYITNSAAEGWDLLWAFVLVWVSFAVVMGLGAPASILVWVVSSIALSLLRVTDKEPVFRIVRWCIVIVGSSALILGGGLLIFDGWANNRMQTAQTLFERCMEPRTTTYTDTYKTCADSWASRSIGRRGACSHHGGVVERYVARYVTSPPHSPEYCRIDASRRSWRD